MIPAMRTSLASALDQIDSALIQLRQGAHLPAPWLADEVSHEVAVHYTRRAMDGPASSYKYLVAYRDELARIHDSLQQMEDHYRRTEGDNAATWGRRA
jgi:hypothetical protein